MYQVGNQYIVSFSLLLVIGIQYSYNINRLSLFWKNCVLYEIQTEILHKCRLTLGCRIKFQLPFNNIKWLSDYSRRWQVKS